MSEIGQPISKPVWIKVDTKKYEQMEKEIDFLECLRAAGVDNWNGYDEALALWKEPK